MDCLLTSHLFINHSTVDKSQMPLHEVHQYRTPIEHKAQKQRICSAPPKDESLRATYMSVHCLSQAILT